jgi:hypothetical protein
VSDYVLGADREKWLIFKGGSTEKWRVLPPLTTFWGKHTSHYTFDEARADFVRQTAPPPGFPKTIKGGRVA